MAMGQGEQRAIHPFFRKDFGVPKIDTLHEFNGSPSHTLPAAALDHDPNTDRRKRRKTGDAVVDLPENDITADADLEHNGLNHLAESQLMGATAEKPGTCDSVDIPPPLQEGVQPQQPLDENANPTPDGPDQKKQKMIKLNANGRLLDSPIADKFPKKSKRKGNNRGKSAPQHTEYANRKLVVIKYINKGRLSESLGQQINDILQGRKKHVMPNRAASPTTVIPTATTTQAAKPTHPFFLKKTVHKPDVSFPQPPASTLFEDGPTRKSELPHSLPGPKPSLSFKHAFSKVPEPMHSLWPPLGLTHVRDLNNEVGTDNNNRSPETDRRKAKTPAVLVNDDESVLSYIKSFAWNIDSSLRHPYKSIMSGRSLQAKIPNRLTGCHANTRPDQITSHDVFHPAVAKLFASLPSSTTPFDRGEYETQVWVQKYAPTSAQQVLCATKEALMLRDWLRHLVVSSVETGNLSRDSEKAKRKEVKKRKRRKKSDKLDGFIVSSDDEASEMGAISGSDDELAGDVTVSTKRTVIRTGDLTFNLRSNNERGRMTNAILLSGPPGCGKTASVYAVAKEMDFEVFEINPGNRRSARDILDRIGDMTQNHLVRKVHDSEDPSACQSPATDSQDTELEDEKQNKLIGFFKPTSKARESSKPKEKASTRETAVKQTCGQKQCLILLEEVDILFEEDKQFWSGVLTLINQSRRPIIITCNDESLVPLDDISFHAILRFRAPSQELAVDYLLLMAANEGHILKRMAVEKLYVSTGNDLRRSISELNYWCQMAVGSDKSGLDWIIERWPQGIDLDSNGDKLRVFSEDTYEDYMGWFSRDILINTGLSTETELREEALHWWQLGLQEADGMEDSRQSLPEPSPVSSKSEKLESLRYQSEYMESRSVLDVLATSCSLDLQKDAIDTSIPPISERQKQNYVEGYRLIHADNVPDYTTLTFEIGSTFQSLVRRTFRKTRERDTKDMLATNILETVSQPKAAHPQDKEFLEALAPAMMPDCGIPPPNGGAELLFEHGQRSIAEDLTPYIRAIVAFDLRLEQYRRELGRLLSGNERGTKRMRTTRASRAALEGGSKAETRKERWFSPAVNIHWVLATGKKEWQDLMVQDGYFTVPVAEEQATRQGSEPISGNASDESI